MAHEHAEARELGLAGGHVAVAATARPKRLSALRLVLTLSVGLVALGVRADDPPAIDVEDFLQRHAGQYVGMLDHPQVACLLQGLVPPERLDAMREVMIRQEGSQWLRTRDADGGFLFVGFLPGGSCQRAALWIHPDGRVLGGDDECTGHLQAWTNDKGLRDHPPAAIVSWLTGASSSATTPPIDWVAPVPKTRLPRSCQRSSLAGALRDYEARLDHALCDADVAFEGDLAIVRPRGHQAAPMASGRSASIAGLPARHRPCLVAGDLVETAFSRNGCTCVRYSGASSMAGWVASGDLAVIPQPTFEKPLTTMEVDAVLALAPAGPPAVRLAGGFDSRGTPLMLEPASGARLHLVATVGVNDGTPNVDETLLTQGSVAWTPVPVGDVPTCGLVLLRGNNGFAIVENGNCGNRYGSLDGLYRKAKADSRR